MGRGDNKTYSSYVPLEVFGELNEIIINVKIIKNEFPKKNSVNSKAVDKYSIFDSLSDSHHQHEVFLLSFVTSGFKNYPLPVSYVVLPYQRFCSS